MADEHRAAIKIRSIRIQNYKGLDNLSIQFPPPLLADKPDIFVMGSRNGLGKTSVIECCALLLLGPILHDQTLRWRRRRYSDLDIPDLLVHSGASAAEISGILSLGDAELSAEMTIDRDGSVEFSSTGPSEQFFKDDETDEDHDVDELIREVCGFTTNPVIEELFLLFHSYRKVQEGKPELGMMVADHRERGPFGRRYPYDLPISAFKLQILRSLMAQADLFDIDEQSTSGETINVLNGLVDIYAGGTISKLRPSPDNTIDFRVMPTNGQSSFTFDGLSSGQKEIISTLFLIWYHTVDRPSVIFIDEPELHLNAEWHRRFVKSLEEIAPKNQYILATHSEDIMDSVDGRQRALLSSE